MKKKTVGAILVAVALMGAGNGSGEDGDWPSKKWMLNQADTSILTWSDSGHK